MKELITHRLGDENCVEHNFSMSYICCCKVSRKYRSTINSLSFEGQSTTKCAIWQTTRATTATPTFLKSISIDNPQPPISYFDGGMEVVIPLTRFDRRKAHTEKGCQSLSSKYRNWTQVRHQCNWHWWVSNRYKGRKAAFCICANKVIFVQCSVGYPYVEHHGQYSTRSQGTVKNG